VNGLDIMLVTNLLNSNWLFYLWWFRSMDCIAVALPPAILKALLESVAEVEIPKDCLVFHTLGEAAYSKHCEIRVLTHELAYLPIFDPSWIHFSLCAVFCSLRRLCRDL